MSDKKPVQNPVRNPIFIPYNASPGYQDFQPIPGLDPLWSHAEWYQKFIESRPPIQGGKNGMQMPLDPDIVVKNNFCRREPNVDYMPVEYRRNSIRRQREREVLLNSCTTVSLDPGRMVPNYGPGGAPVPISSRQAYMKESYKYPDFKY